MRGLLWFVGFLVVTFFLGNYSKWSVDRQLAVLCKKDAGLIVYEQVKLPANRFDKDGNLLPLTPYKVGVDRYTSLFGPDFKLESPSETLIEGTPLDFFSRARLTRSSTKIIRLSDKKILAEDIGYSRVGGGIAEMHPSINDCHTRVNIITSVFIKEE
jgi:hypothetical protein